MEKRRTFKFIITSIFLALFFASLTSSAIVINEAEINPPDSDSGNEWVEVLNTGSSLNLSGWYIQDVEGNNYSFPSIIIVNFFVLDSLTGLNDTNQNLKLFSNLNINNDETDLFNDTLDDDNTYSRMPDSSGNFTFASSTKGLPNVPNSIENKSISLSCVLSTNDVKLNVQADGFCIEQIIFSVFVNGSWQNFTGSNIGGKNYSFEINHSIFAESEYVNWTVFAIDCLNMTTQDGLESFYVNAGTSLTITPSNP